jgi:pyrroline-5-carboxylate reductase
MVLELPGPLLLVGAGKMGGALLEGWLARGLKPEQVLVQDPAPAEAIAALIKRHRIAFYSPAHGRLEAAPSVIVVAVKPQIMDATFAPVGKIAGPGTLVLSIAAGRTIASFAGHLAPGAAIVRAMPNTPAAVGRAITVCVANGAVTPAQRRLCEELMSAVGDVAWVEDEGLMDAVTAVSGSGPAYVFLLAECLEKAGQAAGLDAALARRLAVATVAGAGELLRRSETDPSALRENVTSPGGTTAAALSILMGAGGLEELLKKAVAAGTGRSRELAK